MTTKFKAELGWLDFDQLPLHRMSPTALKKRSDIVIATGKPRCPKWPTLTDRKMHLHRLACGQSITIPLIDNFNYKDAMKQHVKYYSKKSYCYYIVVKHTEYNCFEIARIF